MFRDLSDIRALGGHTSSTKDFRLLSCIAAILRACAALALFGAWASEAGAECALFAAEDSARAADSFELRDAQFAPRFAGSGTGPRPEAFCADVAFDVDDAVRGRYQRSDMPDAMQERVTLSPGHPLPAGLRATTVAERRMPAGLETETTLSQTVAAERAELQSDWSRSAEEDRFGLRVREDWLSGTNSSLSARHGLTALRERGVGRLHLTGVSTELQGVHDGWRLSLRRAGPVPFGRIDTYEVAFGFPEASVPLLPRATGLRTDWASGFMTGVSTWVQWAMYDTDLGLHASHAGQEDWTLAVDWRFVEQLLGAMDINVGMQVDPDGSERRVALAGAFSW